MGRTIRRVAGVAGFIAGLACLAAAQSALAGTVPLAIDGRNVADDGVASVYLTTGGGLITPVANANDTLYTGDIANNLMTITGEFLGIQIDLAAATDLTEVGAYVDPATRDTDPFKNTDNVRFFLSTDSGATYFSPTGAFATVAGALDQFTYWNWTGLVAGVTNVRYEFHQADGGSEGQRIPEVVALQVPLPSSALMGFGLLGGVGIALGVRKRRRAAIA